ncbi:MAG: AsmA family protein [Nitrospirota bacterium]|nr:AsmA family protein [Nitrospirota bacterium]
MKRNIIVGVVIVIGLCLVVILLLPVLLDLNRYRDRYLPLLEQALHRPVDVQDVRLTIFPTLGVRLRDITIADDQAFSPTPFVTIPSAEVVIQWKPLLSRRIQVEHVVIQNPIVRVIRTQDGMLNTATIGKDPSLQPPGKGASGTEGSLKPLLGVFAVERFSMTGGILQYEDRSQEHSRSYQLDNLAFVTNSVQIGQTASIQVQGMVMPYRLSLEMNGRFGPLQSNLDVPVIDVVGRLGKVEATAQGKVMDGRLELDVQIPNVSIDDIPVDLGLVKPVALKQIQAHLMAPLFPNQRLAQSSGVRIDPLTLDLQLGGSTIHLSGKGTPSRFDLSGESPAVFSQDFPLALSVQRPFSLESIRFEAVIQGARVDLMSLNANAFKGSVKAHGKWDGTLSAPMFSLQGNFKHFAVEPILQTVRSSSLSLTGTGELNWSIAASWPTSWRSKVNGPFRLRIQNGQLIGFDLVQAMEEALQLPGLLGETTGSTKFSLIDTQADLEETGLAIRQLTLDAPDFSLLGAGHIGFNRSLTLQGNLAVSPALGDRIIQRFPMAKIARQQGRLVLPFQVLGTVQEPVLQLDTKSFGDQVKKNVEHRLEKALQGDEQELQQLLKDGEELLRQLFGK